jgi:hypothetical protein
MRKTYNAEQRVAVLLLRKDGRTYTEIERLTGVPKSSAEWWVKYPDRQLQKLWTGEELEFLKKHYPDAEKKFLLEGLPRWSWEQIVAGAGNHGIKRKGIYSKVILDFSLLDTEEKAYFLGFSAADGCMVKSNQYEGNYTFVISLSILDYDFLDNLKNLISPASKLRLEGKKKSMVRFSIGDVAFCRQLMKYGIVPKKTHIVGQPKDIARELIPHYIRGLFDGDGCAYIDSKGYLHCSIVGSKKMITFVNNEFKKIYHNNCSVRPTRNSFVISYGGKTGARFAEYIYQDATIKMDRKYQIAKPYLDGSVGGQNK